MSEELLKYAATSPYVETTSLLQDTLETLPQHKATPINYPCTGFCYIVVEYIEIKILLLQYLALILTRNKKPI